MARYPSYHYSTEKEDSFSPPVLSSQLETALSASLAVLAVDQLESASASPALRLTSDHGHSRGPDYRPADPND